MTFSKQSSILNANIFHSSQKYNTYNFFLTPCNITNIQAYDLESYVMVNTTGKISSVVLIFFLNNRLSNLNLIKKNFNENCENDFIELF